MSKAPGPSEPKPNDDARVLATITTLDDPAKLRALIANAKRHERPAVLNAAFHRLATVQSEGEEGSAEFDMWSTIHAIEEIKRQDAGKTIRLSYLRRDIEKIGMVPAMDKLVSKAGASERFDELIEKGHPELTAEAVVLRHPARFSDDAVQRSNERLTGVGIDPTAYAAP